jgi:hypothetical protein
MLLVVLLEIGLHRLIDVFCYTQHTGFKIYTHLGYRVDTRNMLSLS